MKNKKLLLFCLAFLVIVIFGVVVNKLIAYEKERIAEKQDNVINLVKDLGVDRLEQDSFRPSIDGDTEITQKLDGYNDDQLVAIIYVGKTKGYRDNLQVAYAIDVNTDKVVGFKIMENNETPLYLNALLIDEFTSQFENKDLSDKQMKVKAITGVTPGGSNGIIAPGTVSGMDKILKLVRVQYDKDTDFTAPALLKLKSKSQVYPTLNFEYVFDDEGTEITLVVNVNYEFVSITDSVYQTDAMALANEDKVKNYVSNVNGNTVTIKSEGFSGSVITSTAILDGTTITSFTSDLSSQSYEYSPDYNNGSFNPVYDAVKNKGTIPAVTGATITSNGIAAAAEVLYAYIGGNE